MKLYSSQVSSCSRRVRLVAAALGLELEITPIDLASPADRAQLLAVNPNNKVPVLVDADFVLLESNAIAMIAACLAELRTVRLARDPG